MGPTQKRIANPWDLKLVKEHIPAVYSVVEPVLTPTLVKLSPLRGYAVLKILKITPTSTLRRGRRNFYGTIIFKNLDSPGNLEKLTCLR